MSMLFDGFDNRTDAEGFAIAVKEQFGLETAIYDTDATSYAADSFPFELTPPIVHVERTLDATERFVEDLVWSFGGVFAGT